MKVRRVTTGHNAQGKAVIVSDSQVDADTVALMPGAEFHKLWGADQPQRDRGLRSNVGPERARPVRTQVLIKPQADPENPAPRPDAGRSHSAHGRHLAAA